MAKRAKLPPAPPSRFYASRLSVLVAHPGQWYEVGTYTSTSNARVKKKHLMDGTTTLPAGTKPSEYSWEVRYLDADGDVCNWKDAEMSVLYGRYEP